jgi:hypothetical protein
MAVGAGITAEAEVVKLLIMLAAQKAQREGMTQDQFNKACQEQSDLLYKNDPALIPTPI